MNLIPNHAVLFQMVAKLSLFEFANFRSPWGSGSREAQKLICYWFCFYSE